MLTQLTHLVDTRDQTNTPIALTHAIKQSQPESGGLFTPHAADLPQISDAELRAMVGVPYQTVAEIVFSKFDLGLDTDALKNLIKDAYGPQWHRPEITPVSTISKEQQLYLLELGHGPTFAFKNVALEFLARYLARTTTEKVLRACGASSGDTINAANYSVAGSSNLRSIFLLPREGPSTVQRLQALQHGIPNALTILIDGDFDDAQSAIKRFNSPDYADWKKSNSVISFNSIQILRVIAQVVYYFRAYAELVQMNAIQQGDQIDFSVPSGNFGDILAGEFASRMGLPVRKLNIATNANDILHRFLVSGTYQPIQNPDGTRARAKITLAPSQDITISSNFERALYLANGENAAQIRTWMESLKTQGSFTADDATMVNLRKIYTSSVADDTAIIATRTWAYDTHGLIVDPHTATGIHPYISKKAEVPTVCLSTSHPLQFSDIPGAPNSTEYATDLDKLKTNPIEHLSCTAEESSIFATICAAIKLLDERN